LHSSQLIKTEKMQREASLNKRPATNQHQFRTRRFSQDFDFSYIPSEKTEPDKISARTIPYTAVRPQSNLILNPHKVNRAVLQSEFSDSKYITPKIPSYSAKTTTVRVEIKLMQTLTRQANRNSTTNLELQQEDHMPNKMFTSRLERKKVITRITLGGCTI
jgi:hypothetical protein